MKAARHILLAALFAISAGFGAQTIPVRDLLGPDNTLRNPVHGISFAYTAGWEVRAAHRWGKDNRENTAVLHAVWPSDLGASVDCAPLERKPAPGAEEAHWREAAAR